MLQSAHTVTDPAVDAAVHRLSASMLAKYGGHPLVACRPSPACQPDVWNISLTAAPSAAVVPSSLISVDSIASAGSVVRDRPVTHTLT